MTYHDSTATGSPAQAAANSPPVRMSQYVRGSIPVAIVVSTATAARLMATKPLVRREKAMALAPSSHQWLTSVPATSFRKATIPRMDGSRGSHTHWPTVAASRLDAHVTALVLPPASDGGPIMFPAGQANA